MSALLELAARCEAATDPDRELDGAVRKAVHGDFGFCGDNEGAWQCCACMEPAIYLTQEPGCGAPMGLSDERTSYPNDWREDARLPYYTASLDAAMTLAPNGHVMSGLSQEDTDNPQRKWAAEYRRGFKTSYDKAFPARAATGPLALCAASLRARHALLGTKDHPNDHRQTRSIHND